MSSPNRLIIHVGAPKCGSSSLQTVLSRIERFSSSFGDKFCYAAILANGQLATGAELHRIRMNRVEASVRSADVDELLQLNTQDIARLASDLNKRLSETSVILSCEGWLQRVDDFATLNLLEKIEAPVEIVAYVRPQPEYLNAHWWQWGAWSSATFVQWTYHIEYSTWAWATLMQRWAAVSDVSAIHVSLLPADVIAHFFGRLSCDVPQAVSVNRTLPVVALRFLQRHRDLRPNVHASDIDFVLEGALQRRFTAPPWVLPLAHVTHVLKLCRADNLALMDLLSVSDRVNMQADPRWWAPSFYQGRTVEAPDAVAPVAGDVDAFAAELARALLESERENVRLRAAIALRKDAE